MATQEQLDLRAKWIAALRSGKYKQTTGTLKNRTGAFCCLGVLCDVAGIKPVFVGGQNHFKTANDEECNNLPSDIVELAGLTDNGGGYEMNSDHIKNYPDKRVRNEGCLVGLNDDTIMRFKDIADFIESNPPGLFVDDAPVKTAD